MKSEKEIVEEMQTVVEQMRLDDIEDNPDIVDETFECDLLRPAKVPCRPLLNMMVTDSVMTACFLLKQVLPLINFNIEELINAMEDKRLEGLCSFITEEEKRKLN